MSSPTRLRLVYLILFFIAISCLFWYAANLFVTSNYNTTKPVILIKQSSDTIERNVNRNINVTDKITATRDLSHITDPSFIEHNIHYTTLTLQQQQQRYDTFQQYLHTHMVLNESSIINNWKQLNLNECANIGYTSLNDLYDAKYINLKALSQNICEWEHKTNRQINTKAFGTDSFEYISKSVVIQQYMMSELFLKYGIITILRAGELMGAFRDGGHFPWESSSDHWAILPNAMSVQCFHALNYKLVDEMNAALQNIEDEDERSVSQQSENGMSDGSAVYKYTASKGYWDRYLRSAEFWMEYDSFWSDGTLLDFNVLKMDRFNELFHERLNVWPREYFNDYAICLCNYSGTIAFAFQEKQIDMYLSITYDADYMNPHPQYKGSIERIKGYEISSFVLWENDCEIANNCQRNASQCFV